MAATFDAIIVGAGTSGSVLARRLIDAGRRVLLAEAGGDDSNPAIHDPMRMGELWHSKQDWDYYTTPQAHAAGRRLHLPRGKVLGGSHALNAMIWVRGAPQDFDHWAEAGNDGWAWKDVLPVYQAIESVSGLREDSDLRGHSGLMDVVDGYELHPIQRSIIDAAMQTDLEWNPDYNGESQDGISQQQLTVRGGERLSTYRAYLQPVSGSPLLTLRTNTLVHRVLVESGKAHGIEFEVDGQREKAFADEVILCAGAIDSPRILLQSGIGPGDELRELDIDVVLDSPGVGKNLHDHLLSPVIFTTDSREVAPPRSGQSVTQTQLFWRSRSGLEVPDTQPINFSVPMYEPWMTGPSSGFSLMAGIVTPQSRGSIRITSATPGSPLLIDLNALADHQDLQSLVASVQQCRRIGAAPALAGEWGARELYPGADVSDDAALTDYVRNTAITYHHQVGTCRMGIDDAAVVDPQLRLHGISGLRIADASIMPRITTGNTNAPSALIGEKAAAFLLG